MDRAISKGTEAKSKMKHSSAIVRPGFETRFYRSVANRGFVDRSFDTSLQKAFVLDRADSVHQWRNFVDPEEGSAA